MPRSSFAPSGDDLLRFAPEIILTIAGTLLMVLDPLFAKRYPKLFGHLSILALARRCGRHGRSLLRAGFRILEPA